MRKLLNTLYVTDSKAFLSKKENNLLVRVENQKEIQVPFHILESVVLFGYLGCTPSVLGECAERGISLSFLDEIGRFRARIEGPTSGNILLRRKQYQVSDNVDSSLFLSKRFIAAKIHNYKIVLQRHIRDNSDSIHESLSKAVNSLTASENKVFETLTLDELRGVEGDAAHVYFSVFNFLLKDKTLATSFTGRVKRPPTDPANALLSLFYTLLNSDIVSACETVGLDPQAGFLHRDRPGRASLALDLMEELRAYCVDRFVLSLFNRRQLTSSDFDFRIDGSVVLKKDARKKALSLWQERKQDEITHPFLGEKLKIGLLPYVQAQLFARYLREDLEDYPAFIWR